MDLLTIQAMWILGLLSKDLLPGIANQAMESGLDSRALRLLAGLSPDEFMEAPVLFSEALKELGLPTLSKVEAARSYATSISKEILSGRLDPRTGARKLWDASVCVDDVDFHELDTFEYAASELESRPEDDEFFINEILKEAKRWAQFRGSS